MLKRIEIEGLDLLKRRLSGMIAHGENMLPLFRDIAAIMADEVEGNFDAQGRPPWKPSKRAQREGGKTLQDTGQLAASIQEFVTATSAGVGTNKEYAAIHHFGGDITRYPFSSTVRLRTLASGALMRQTGFDNLARFAGARHKRAVTRRFTSSGFTITMPSRPYMVITPGGMGKIEAAAREFLFGL